MKNAAVADALDEMADLLEIKGESAFRIQAYHRAAAGIRDLGKDIETLYSSGELTSLYGIGTSIAEKIGEIITTGTCQALEELRTEIPPSLRELTRIPGLGPKKATIIWDKLGITTAAELKKAIEEGKLRSIRGFSQKTEENILRNMTRISKKNGRIRLDEAYNTAEPLIQALRENPAVEKIDPAGSIRRMRETVGDIDILVSSRDPGSVMDTFCALPMVTRVQAKGETKSSVVTTTGLQADLRVVSPEQYGSALQYFTGSKEHSVRLREIARSRGLKISEYGIFNNEDDARLGGAEEGDIYRILEMDYVPPVLREDRGEIEAAMAGALPKLVELTDIKGDMQLHSKYSDGVSDIKDIAQEAAALGYEWVILTDHAERLHIAGGMTIEEFRKLRKKVEALNEEMEGKVTMLLGVELNIGNEGDLDYPDEQLAEFDFCLCSIHSGFHQPRDQMTGRIINAMQNPYCAAIAHPTGRLIGKREPYLVDMEQVFRQAKETGTFMEINSFPDRLDLSDEYVRVAKEAGVKFTMGTDAHAVNQMRYMRYGVSVAQRGWATADDILNTLSLTDLKKALSLKRP